MTARLGLRAQLALAFAVAAAVPLVAIEQLSTRIVRREFERSTEAQFEAMRRLVEAQVAEQGEWAGARVGEAASDYALRDALLAFEVAGAGGTHARLIETTAATAARLGLPLLAVIGDDGRIVATAEEPARFDVRDPRLAELARARPGRPFLAEAGGIEVRGLVLRVARPLEGGSGRFWLVGGSRVEHDLLARLQVAEPMALLLATRSGLSALSSPAGQAALTAAGGPAAPGPVDAVAGRLEAAGYRVEAVRLGPVYAAEPVRFLLATSLAPLERALGEIQRSFLALLVAGLGLAWALAWALARRWTDPISELVRGFERVAGGELDVRLAVERGDELGRMADAFHAMTHDLAESRERLLAAERIAAWREIARQLAHEIKNPLSPIALSMETLRRAHRNARPDFPQLLEECTRTVLEEVDRLRRTVQEFSDFARLPRPRRIAESFHEVVRGVVALHSGGGHLFELDLEPGEGRFEFDPDQMNRLLVNLVKNAIEAMPGGGTVRIATRTDAVHGRFVLTVADQGAGVPAEAAARLFEPYVTHKTGGTGLGLAIVRRIAEEHGGTARLENPGQPGARFVVEISLSAA